MPSLLNLPDIRVEGLQWVTPCPFVERGIQKLTAPSIGKCFEDVKVYPERVRCCKRDASDQRAPGPSPISSSPATRISRKSSRPRAMESSGFRVGDPLGSHRAERLPEKGQDFCYGVGKYSRQGSRLLSPFCPQPGRPQVHLRSKGKRPRSTRSALSATTSPEEMLLAQLPLGRRAWWNFTGDQRYQKQKLAGDIEVLRLLLHGPWLSPLHPVESTQVSHDRTRRAFTSPQNVRKGSRLGSASSLKVILIGRRRRRPHHPHYYG